MQKEQWPKFPIKFIVTGLACYDEKTFFDRCGDFAPKFPFNAVQYWVNQRGDPTIIVGGKEYSILHFKFSVMP